MGTQAVDLPGLDVVYMACSHELLDVEGCKGIGLKLCSVVVQPVVQFLFS
ncbi:hypothetical protein [Methanolobus psychrotolerans]|nr:hypothetical protein [Methanolobus psychrotolerans]